MPEPSYLIISLVFSSIGLGYFIYGRKQKHQVAFYSGVCLLLYCYVITEPVWMIGAGVALMLAPKLVRL